MLFLSEPFNKANKLCSRDSSQLAKFQSPDLAGVNVTIELGSANTEQRGSVADAVKEVVIQIGSPALTWA